MKVETPQLRWHQIINPQSKKDAGANGPILSCSLLSINDTMGVLATAGNTEVNLWRVGFTPDEARRLSLSSSKSKDGGNATTTKNHILVQPQTTSNTTNNNNPPNKQQITEHTQITHIVTLSRGTNERSINAVKFSPSGTHLVAAGDGGTVVVWTLPPPSTTTIRNNNNNNNDYWSTIERETDLPMKILFNQSDDVMDVAWSADSKRFTVCSLDHTMTVWEQVDNTTEEWRNVHRSAKDHTHYIQGVAYDPKGVYLASMGSDRMVKVYSRKGVKDGVVRGELAKYTIDKSEEEVGSNVDSDDQQQQQGKEDDEQDDTKAILQSKVLPEILTNSTFALQNKIKTLKFLDPAKSTTAASNASGAEKELAQEEGAAVAASSPTPTNTNAKRHHMFADELTLGSFFRRLAFTTDGAFLVVPAALWHGKNNNAASSGSTRETNAPASPTSVVSSEDKKLAESSFATYLFARHHFEQPYKVLTGLEKPSVVVRPNPVLFQLPSNNVTPTSLPYRSIFAVLTADTVLIYDTHHNYPLAMARGLHYAGLTDAAWSNDGRTLFVTSSDGYISILSFGDGELGTVYVPPKVKVVEKKVSAEEAGDSKAASSATTPSDSSKQPDSNGAVVNTLVPKKKSKAATAPSSSTGDCSETGSNEVKKVTFSPVNDIKQIEPRQQPAFINTLVPKKKKKKKIVPTLLTTPSQTVTQTQNNSGEEGAAEKTIAEKKRPIEEAAAAAQPTELLPGASVNILVPKKKKKKVAGSSVPVATS